RQLNEYDLTDFLPIKYKDTNIGWVNKGNQTLLASSCKKISYLNIIEFQKNRSKLHVSDECCPVFNYSSLNPKLKFSDNKR